MSVGRSFDNVRSEASSAVEASSTLRVQSTHLRESTRGFTASVFEASLREQSLSANALEENGRYEASSMLAVKVQIRSITIAIKNRAYLQRNVFFYACMQHRWCRYACMYMNGVPDVNAHV